MSNLVDHSHRILDQNVRNQTTYAVNTKIMVAAVVVLLVVVLFILLLHIYARWFWRNARIGSSNWSRRLRRRRHRMRFDFVIAEPPPFAIDAHTSKGLDKEILNTLPVFIYKKIKNKSEEMKQQDEEFGQAVEFQEDDELDCAVCLSEFEENETGRRLPKCEHIFHTDCIDMWLSSHSTCPLCRVSVIDPPHLLHQSEGAHSQNPFPNNNNSNSSSSSVDSTTPVAASENQNGIFGNLPMQQPQYPANILFWGNQAYITSPLQEIVITSSSSSSSSSNNSSSSRSKPKQNLMIDVPPRRSTANLSSASSSPTTMMERSPLGNHLRNIRRLLSNSNSSTPK